MLDDFAIIVVKQLLFLLLLVLFLKYCFSYCFSLAVVYDTDCLPKTNRYGKRTGHGITYIHGKSCIFIFFGSWHNCVFDREIKQKLSYLKNINQHGIMSFHIRLVQVLCAYCYAPSTPVCATGGYQQGICHLNLSLGQGHLLSNDFRVEP